MVDWLLKGEPREVQLEALRRSYYGVRRYDANPDYYPDQEILLEQAFLNRDGPARGWGHFLQMRLGKTPTLLNEYQLARRDYGVKNLIVLTPNKYKLDWPLEAQRFGVDVPGLAFESTDRERVNLFFQRNRSGFLASVNYEALGYAKTIELLSQYCGPDTMIGADESIHLMNPDTKWTVSALQLAKLCGWRRVMSGKYINRGPHDAWAQMRFCGALDGFNYYAFKTVFCRMGGFQGKKVMGAKPGTEEKFHKLIGASSWTARRSDWLKTPGVDYTEEMVDYLGGFGETIMRHYKQMEEDFLTQLEDGSLVAAEQIVHKIVKMQQIAGGFILDERGQYKDLVPLDKNPKAQHVKRKLRGEINGKLVVVYHFKRSGDILLETLKDFNPVVIRGEMSQEDVVEAKRVYNNESSCRVAVVQMKAGRYGHNLMGAPGDQTEAMMFYENTYSLDDRSQIEERPQGSGQEEALTVIDLMATKHDRAPIRALQRKEDVAALMMRYDRSTGILPPRPELGSLN